MDANSTPPSRCVVCGRRLKSQPWAKLGIGPVCARKNPAQYAVQQEYDQAVEDVAQKIAVDVFEKVFVEELSAEEISAEVDKIIDDRIHERFGEPHPVK